MLDSSLQPLSQPESTFSSSSSSTPRRFQINRPAFKFSYEILTEDSSNQQHTPLYRVKNGAHTRNAPALALHSGPSEAAPVIAVCHMPHFSLNYKIGFGDPEADPDAVRWEDMVKTKFNSAEHRFSVTMCEDYTFPRSNRGKGGEKREEEKEGRESTSLGQRHEFVWKRTRHVCVSGRTIRKASPRNWKLVDEENDNQVLAIFNDDATIGICGVLQIEQDRGRDFDVVVMITLLALYERSRRG